MLHPSPPPGSSPDHWEHPSAALEERSCHHQPMTPYPAHPGKHRPEATVRSEAHIQTSLCPLSHLGNTQVQQGLERAGHSLAFFRSADDPYTSSPLVTGGGNRPADSAPLSLTSRPSVTPSLHPARISPVSPAKAHLSLQYLPFLYRSLNRSRRVSYNTREAFGLSADGPPISSTANDRISDGLSSSDTSVGELSLGRNYYGVCLEDQEAGTQDVMSRRTSLPSTPPEGPPTPVRRLHSGQLADGQQTLGIHGQQTLGIHQQQTLGILPPNKSFGDLSSMGNAPAGEPLLHSPPQASRPSKSTLDVSSSLHSIPPAFRTSKSTMDVYTDMARRVAPK